MLCVHSVVFVFMQYVYHSMNVSYIECRILYRERTFK